MILAALPIKPFGVAKARLSPVLDAAQRSRLGRAVAARTARLAVAAGGDVVVVTGDEGVASWAKSRDLGVLLEDPTLGPGLNGAAGTIAQHAAQLGMPWVLVHADLPIAAVSDLTRVFEGALSGPVIVPSHDGGTNLMGGVDADFRFAFGKGSFRRHLARIPDATIVTSPRLGLDLDTPMDLARARAATGGAWLEDVIGAPSG